MVKKSEYECQKCKKIFESFDKKLDAVCPYCGSLDIQYTAAEKASMIAPAKAGQYRELVEKKHEENDHLRELQDSLALNVKGLWKMIKVLELRKRQLENYIGEMEKYLSNSSDLLDFIKKTHDDKETPEQQS